MTPPNTQQPKAFDKYEDHEQQEQPTLEVEDIVDSTGKLMWNFLMAKSKSMQPTSLLKTC